MTDWNQVKCKQCKSNKLCRRTNTSKGSPNCKKVLKLVPLKEKDLSKTSKSHALMWGLMQKMKAGK